MNEKKPRPKHINKPNVTIHTERRREIWYMYWIDKKGYHSLTAYDLRTLRQTVDARLKRMYGSRSKRVEFRFLLPVMIFGNNKLQISWTDYL